MSRAGGNVSLTDLLASLALNVDTAYPHLAPLLATPCDLAVYEFRLSSAGR